MNKTYSRVIPIISMVLFAVSLTQVGYCTHQICRSSIDALITGSVGFLYGGAVLTWLANPLLLTSWLLINRNISISLVTSLLAMLVSFSFFFCRNVIDNEAGQLGVIVSYKAGYWLWAASTTVMGVGNCILYVRRHRISPTGASMEQ